VPGSEWNAEYKESTASAPMRGLKWRKVSGVVRHVFTHFPLELTVYVARVPKRTRAPKDMRFVPLDELDREALPSVMRKVIAHALQA